MKINLNKRLFHSEKGFTLLELLVVIAIIGILSTVVIAMTSKARARGRDGQRYSDIRQINNAIQLYILANGHAPYLDACYPSQCVVNDTYSSYLPSNWAELATKLQPYIKKLPVDPCGSNCDDEPNGIYSHYSYGSPGTGRSYNANNPNFYQIWAGNLETMMQPFGFGANSSGAFSSE